MYLSDAVWAEKSNDTICFFLCKLEHSKTCIWIFVLQCTYNQYTEKWKKRITQPFYLSHRISQLDICDIKLKNATEAHLEDILEKVSEFFEKLKIFWNIKKNRKYLWHIFSFLNILKIWDSSFVASSIPRHLMPKKLGPS